jgi:hypothetical protein
MDIQWQIHIINDLIRENPDSTIADYFDIVREIEAVDTNKPAPVVKPKRRTVNDFIKQIEQEVISGYLSFKTNRK